jgi:hypothetical protein
VQTCCTWCLLISRYSQRQREFWSKFCYFAIFSGLSSGLDVRARICSLDMYLSQSWYDWFAFLRAEFAVTTVPLLPCGDAFSSDESEGKK